MRENVLKRLGEVPPAPFEDALLKLSDEQRWKVREIDDQATGIRDLLSSLGKSHEMSLALVNFEQCVMWAKRHVTDRSARG